MAPINSFKVLEQAVLSSGGIMEVRMEVLRDCVGAGKLGSHVLDEIRHQLRRAGLVVLGGKLPNDHRHSVWLIARSAPYGPMLLELLSLMRRDAGHGSGEAA